MNRKRYIANRELSLAEYCPQVDGQFHYECWQDPAIQEGYNYKIRAFMDEFCNRPIRLRLLAVIIRNEDNESLGIVSLSPEGSAPDLAIMLYKPYRGKGYGANAFALTATATKAIISRENQSPSMTMCSIVKGVKKAVYVCRNGLPVCSGGNENRLGAIEKKKFFEYNESVAGERS